MTVIKEYQQIVDKLQTIQTFGPETQKIIDQCCRDISRLGTKPNLPLNVEKFYELTHEMATTYLHKNKDYGNSFDKSIDQYGLVAAIVRMSDKMNRLDNLIKSSNQEVKDESLQDTLLDLANYALMTILYIQNHENNI